MQVVIVDNDAEEIKKIYATLCDAIPEIAITPFCDPLLSAKYICNNKVDIAFIEMQTRPTDGISLMKVLRTHKSKLIIVLMSNDESLKKTALINKADAFLTKPITRCKLDGVIRLYGIREAGESML